MENKTNELLFFILICVIILCMAVSVIANTIELREVKTAVVDAIHEELVQEIKEEQSQEPEPEVNYRVEEPEYLFEDRYLLIACEAVEDAETGTIVRYEETQVIKQNALTSDSEASQGHSTVYNEPISASYDEEWLLAWIIYMEAGSDWIPDYVQQYVGSVVLNRVASPKFPNTITEVLYQPGQYYAAMTGLYYEPNERAKENARYLLENGSVLPADVLFQANFKQGTGIYHEYQDPYLGSSYFCYG